MSSLADLLGCKFRSRQTTKPLPTSITKCYQESEKRMAKFQQTLQSFVYLLRERNVDKELNIEIKDPGDLTMEDVLTIIGKIQESRNTKQVKSCKDFIHKCYRKAESKRGIAEAALTMIPNDAYGSVISGGFTLILAVSNHVCSDNPRSSAAATPVISYSFLLAVWFPALS